MPIKWQLASQPAVLPSYNEALLRRELNLFPDLWYMARHLGTTLSERQKQTLESLFALLVDSALAQAKLFVHRDLYAAQPDGLRAQSRGARLAC